MAYLNYHKHTFHNAATSASNGDAFYVKGLNTLTIEIYGSEANTARTLTFYGKGPSGTLRLIPGVKVSGDANFTIATSTTGTGEVWQFDITGLESVVIDLTAITGGNITVIGNVN